MGVFTRIGAPSSGSARSRFSPRRSSGGTAAGRTGSCRFAFRMHSLLKKLEASPLLARVVPFAVFVALTFCQGKLGESSRYWIYSGKTVVGAWLLWVTRPFVAEMKWKLSWEAVVVGVAVFMIWVGLDGLYPSFDRLMIYTGLGKAK